MLVANLHHAAAVVHVHPPRLTPLASVRVDLAVKEPVQGSVNLVQAVLLNSGTLEVHV